ncbi:hypothetical protein N8668_02125 [bacterium]|nr:hypothetical protein [bacterium]
MISPVEILLGELCPQQYEKGYEVMINGNGNAYQWMLFKHLPDDYWQVMGSYKFKQKRLTWKIFYEDCNTLIRQLKKELRLIKKLRFNRDLRYAITAEKDSFNYYHNHFVLAVKQSDITRNNLIDILRNNIFTSDRIMNSDISMIFEETYTPADYCTKQDEYILVDKLTRKRLRKGNLKYEKQYGI